MGQNSIQRLIVSIGMDSCYRPQPVGGIRLTVDSNPNMWPFKKRVTPSEKAAETAADRGAPVHCSIEFESNGERSLKRLTEFFDLVKAAKDSDEPADESQLLAYLTGGERSYFSNFTPEEQAEWNEFWFSTPLRSATLLRCLFRSGTLLPCWMQFGMGTTTSLQFNRARHGMCWSSIPMATHTAALIVLWRSSSVSAIELSV